MLTKERELLIWGMQARILQTERMANKQRWFTGMYLDVSLQALDSFWLYHDVVGRLSIVRMYYRSHYSWVWS